MLLRDVIISLLATAIAFRFQKRVIKRPWASINVNNIILDAMVFSWYVTKDCTVYNTVAHYSNPIGALQLLFLTSPLDFSRSNSNERESDFRKYFHQTLSRTEIFKKYLRFFPYNFFN